MECVAILKCQNGEIIKVYSYDHDDYRIVTSGSVKFPELFCSKSGGIERAFKRAQELNNLTILEKIF